MASPRIFISYRRGESAGHAARLHEALARATGERYVFLDRESIPAGDRFEQVIRDRIDAANKVLVVMGRRWASLLAADGQRRLDDPNDLVRKEIEHALEAGKIVVPVLVEGGEVPRPEELPHSLRRLSALQAFVITDQHWRRDISRLVRVVAGARLIYRVSTSWLARIGFVLAAFLIVVVGIALYATRAVAQAGEQFLRELGEGQYEQAYAHMSPRARENTSPDRLAADANGFHLSKMASFRWSSRYVSGGRGDLKGTIVLANGENVPVKLELTKTTQGWLVSGLEAEGRGRLDSSGVPPDQVVLLLTNQAVSRFVDATLSGDFVPFWNLGAQRFRENNSPANLKLRFAGVSVAGESPGSCQDPRMVFSEPPGLGTAGEDHEVLALKGWAACPSAELHFELYYTYEQGRWRLIGAGFRREPARDPGTRATPRL